MGELDGQGGGHHRSGFGHGQGVGQACSSARAPRWWRPTSAAPKQTTADEVGGDVLPVHCDVTQEDQVEALMAAAIEAYGRVDAVLNVAGVADGGPLTDLTMEFYDRLMDVDLRGVFLGMKHGIRAMLPTGGGSIVNWSSVGGLNGSAYTSVYQAAKHGIIGASKSAAIEYGTQGIRVNVICPGFILTEIMAQGAEDFIPDIAAKAALNRAGESPEVAEVGAFLASDRASFVTGAVIPVDGGWSAKLA